MASLAAVATDLREQWGVLREWLEQLPDPASAEPSMVPGWSIGDLVAHLGRAMDAMSACRVATGVEPLTLGEYLATYANDPDGITATTQQLAGQIADDPLDRLDELADRALAHLELLAGQGEDVVVIARRGPIRLVDFAITRLIELVVHGYDLAPELPLPVPIDPTARTIVAQALMGVARARTGEAISVGDEASWVLVASGRIDWHAAVARGAVRPEAASDGLPDLSTALPLL